MKYKLNGGHLESATVVTKIKKDTQKENTINNILENNEVDVFWG